MGLGEAVSPTEGFATEPRRRAGEESVRHQPLPGKQAAGAGLVAAP
jgi:hypothetical protein